MRTWDATGLLAPIWQELDREDGKPGPGRRDDLAAITGIAGPTLSQYNAGTRRLGLGHAKEILKAAPQGYTLADLGMPGEVGSITARLERIEVIARRIDAWLAQESIDYARDRLGALDESDSRQLPGDP